MNLELKALFQLALDGFTAGKAAIAKSNFVTVVLPDLYKLAADIPAVAASWSDLKAEIDALAGSQQEADLVAYVIANVPNVTTNAHAALIVDAVLDLVTAVVQKGVALELAIQGKSPAAAA